MVFERERGRQTDMQSTIYISLLLKRERERSRVYISLFIEIVFEISRVGEREADSKRHAIKYLYFTFY